MNSSLQLAKSPLFQLRSAGRPLNERIRLTFERAKAVAHAYALTSDDVLNMTEKFWKMHTDPAAAVMDGAASVLLTLQYNLCAGTLAMFAVKQPDVNEVLQEVLSFEVSGQFLLTEVAHGLDAIHIETTATLLPNGDWDLNTPREQAAKYMPPTAPAGTPCVAVVFAKAIINGEDCGIRPFVVHIHDGKDMHPGVVSKLLPQRGGSRPVHHSITYFHHVRLPKTALLGSPEKPADPRATFFHGIFRVAVGTLAIGTFCVPVLQASAYIAGRYSMRRTVVDVDGGLKPIISFRTQKIPVLTALAQSVAIEAWMNKAIAMFRDTSLDGRVRHAIAAISKVVMIQHTMDAGLVLADRCGAQGLFEVNQITGMFSDMRGAVIAEGDLLGISIRLASELLLKRYAVPSTSDPTSLLAKHEAGMFEELRGLLAGMRHHRSADFDLYILPECLSLIQAIGHRMVYDAAVAANLDACLVDLYVASCVKLDSAWYVEKLGVSRRAQRDMENKAIDAVYPRLEEFLDKLALDPYITAPIFSEDRWERFVNSLPTFPPSRGFRDDSAAYAAAGHRLPAPAAGDDFGSGSGGLGLVLGAQAMSKGGDMAVSKL
ncbi:hypothetical protein EW146_g4131 [Bondarzewia mesenterica]|uniref:Acyl-CoA oxidase C-alpha1 domain-containing protein n=1 Tax=Bondarzewia mesenterica TaxID=1095465 RepID=A0A4S4LVE4_9AGAM|nr:hypothetical protein EW146_g4131 [Bondarzewia mesenterica]